VLALGAGAGAGAGAAWRWRWRWRRLALGPPGAGAGAAWRWGRPTLGLALPGQPAWCAAWRCSCRGDKCLLPPPASPTPSPTPPRPARAGFLPEVAPEGEQQRVLAALQELLEQDLAFMPAALEAAANMHLPRELQVRGRRSRMQLQAAPPRSWPRPVAGPAGHLTAACPPARPPAPCRRRR
jgi:hypothetical protein